MSTTHLCGAWLSDSYCQGICTSGKIPSHAQHVALPHASHQCVGKQHTHTCLDGSAPTYSAIPLSAMHTFPRLQLYCRTQQTLSLKHFEPNPSCSRHPSSGHPSTELTPSNLYSATLSGHSRPREPQHKPSRLIQPCDNTFHRDGAATAVGGKSALPSG